MSRGTMMTSSQSHSAPTDGGGRIRAAESRGYIQGGALDGGTTDQHACHSGPCQKSISTSASPSMLCRCSRGGPFSLLRRTLASRAGEGALGQQLCTAEQHRAMEDTRVVPEGCAPGAAPRTHHGVVSAA